MVKIKLRMGGRTVKEVEELEVYVETDRFVPDDGFMSVKFTSQGVIADFWNKEGTKLIKSFSMMYDEFVEHVMREA